MDHILQLDIEHNIIYYNLILRLKSGSYLYINRDQGNMFAYIGDPDFETSPYSMYNTLSIIKSNDLHLLYKGINKNVLSRLKNLTL